MYVGRHMICDIYGCNTYHLRDEDYLNSLFDGALKAVGATILRRFSFKFPAPGGVTGIYLLSESHASYHSYPEYGYIAVDFFTCGDCNPEIAVEILDEGLAGKRGYTNYIDRGQIEQARNESPWLSQITSVEINGYKGMHR